MPLKKNNRIHRLQIGISGVCLLANVGYLTPAWAADPIVEGSSAIVKSLANIQDFTFPKDKDIDIYTSADYPNNFEPSLQDSSQFYLTHPSYLTIAKAVSDKSYKPAYYSLEASRLSSKTAVQERLPQVSREASYTDSGSFLGRIDIDQVIIGNGRFAARKRVLNAQEAQAVARYEIDENDRIAEGLTAFLNAVHQSRKVDEIDEFVEVYDKFLNMADARVNGGVANRTEFRLFELKKAQARSERQQSLSEFLRYKVELEALTEKNFSEIDFNAFKFDPWLHQVPRTKVYGTSVKSVPQFRLAEADIHERAGELAQEKSAYRPQLFVRGSFGHDTDFAGVGSDFQTEARLVLRISQPIYWGKNHRVEALGSEISAAKAQLLQTQRDIGVDLQVQDALMTNYIKQLEVKRELAALADNRSLGFEEDFKAGAVSMAEAVSIIETAKSVKLDVLDTLYLTRLTELEKAKTLGLLGPIETPKEGHEEKFEDLILLGK